jgi:DNA-binding NarL/FixJ family response regulator
LIKILIADAHALVRRGLKGLIETRADWTVCGVAATGREAVQLAEEFEPDVAILDLGLPVWNGIEVSRQMMEVSPRTQTLLLSLRLSDEIIHEAVGAGVKGYVLKSDYDQDLLLAIEKLVAGQPFFTSAIAESIWLRIPGVRTKSHHDAKEFLTRRQRQVVQLLAGGQTSKQVASKLKISVKTAETHRTNIMRKLDIHSVTDLVRYAVRNHLIEP